MYNVKNVSRQELDVTIIVEGVEESHHLAPGSSVQSEEVTSTVSILRDRAKMLEVIDLSKTDNKE